MKRFFLLSALLAAFLMIGTTAWSRSYTDHVSTAPNGKGDLIVYPFYMGMDGFQTKIQVVNTSLTSSAVAKVVVRTYANSQEVLDFFIFLSPTDAWEGYLRPNAAGRTEMYSEDPSTLIGATAPYQFASASNPAVFELWANPCDDHRMGYVEVYLTHVQTGDEPARVTKNTIASRYIGAGTLRNPEPVEIAGPSYFLPGTASNAGIATSILAGFMELQTTLMGGTTAALNPVIFKDYLIDIPQGLDETALGAGANNNLLEVEAALSKNAIAMPYINNQEGSSIHFFSFPTKMSRIDGSCNYLGQLGPYSGFDTANRGRVEFSDRIMDMEENHQFRTPGSPVISPAPTDPGRNVFFPFEVNMYIASHPQMYSNGWILYTLTDGPTSNFNLDGQGLSYTGAPVIPVVMNFKFEPADYSAKMSLKYGAWTDGQVTGDGGPLPGYQYIRSN